MRIVHAAALGLVVASLAATPSVARAQKGGMLIGPWVGLNFATFGGSSATNTSTRTGIALGGQLQATLAPSIFLRVGALYSMRGASSSNPSGTAKVNYIEFPVVVGYQFAMQGSQVKPYVMAGGQFGFKASCNVESGGTTSDCNTALGTTVASTDFGFTFGAGVGFPAGTGHIMIDARYYIGMTNLISNAGGGAELKNKGFTVGAGYMIPFGRR
jgi:opacity protein-like surface antigen